MSQYHTQAAFEKRMADRRANPRPLDRPEVFYHIGCLHHWRDVVTEQLRLLAFCGFTRVTSGIVGTKEDSAWCVERAKSLGIDLAVCYCDPDPNTWEHPTLQTMYDFAVANPSKAVLYLHSKGVTCPPGHHEHDQKAAWRRVMQKHVVGDWKQNLRLLEVADAVGVNWQDLPNFPHYSGNFWMARCDWLASLTSPRDYKANQPGNYNWDQPWVRMHVELWLGSIGWHEIVSLGCRHENLWNAGYVFSMDQSIEGFSYYPPVTSARQSTVSALLTAIPPRRERLAKALASVAMQTRPVDQIVVRMDYERLGAAVNLARAFNAVTCDYVAKLDDDDEFLPVHVERLLSVAEQTGADVVYSWFTVVGGTDPFPHCFGMDFDGVKLKKRELRIPSIALIRSNAIRDVGGFPVPGDYDYPIPEEGWGDGDVGNDHILWLRLLRHGAKFVHLPERTWLWHHWTDAGRVGNTSGNPARW